MYIFYFYLIKLWSILIKLEIFKLEILFFDLEGLGLGEKFCLVRFCVWNFYD